MLDCVLCVMHCCSDPIEGDYRWRQAFVGERSGDVAFRASATVLYQLESAQFDSYAVSCTTCHEKNHCPNVLTSSSVVQGADIVELMLANIAAAVHIS